MTEEEVVLHHDKCQSFNRKNKKEVGYGQPAFLMKVRHFSQLNWKLFDICFSIDVHSLIYWKTIFRIIFCFTTGSNNGRESLKQRRPSRAYLLRQKATGEETVVTLVPIQGDFLVDMDSNVPNIIFQTVSTNLKRLHFIFYHSK